MVAPTAVSSPRTPASRRVSATLLTPRTPGAESEQKADKLQRALAKAREGSDELSSEVQGLESALTLRTVELTAAAAREREALEEGHTQQLVESREGVRRLQHAMRQMRSLVTQEYAPETRRLLAAQAAELRAEAERTAEQAVEVVRSQMEQHLFRQTSHAESNAIELRQARQVIADRDATIASMRDELVERRQAMNRLHAACARTCNVAAASAFASALPESMAARLNGAPPPPHSSHAAPQQPTPSQPPSTPVAVVATIAQTPMPVGGFNPGGACGCRTDIRPRVAAASLTGLGTAESLALAAAAAGAPSAASCENEPLNSEPNAPRSCASASVACMSATKEAARVSSMAEDELARRMGLAKAERALQQAAARETASASAHAHSVESYEAELRCAGAREAVLRGELRPLEAELSSHVGVYSVLQRTLAQLAEAETRAAEAAQAAGESAAATRRAQNDGEESRQEAEEALSRALLDREARQRSQDMSNAAMRRAERELVAAESAKTAAMNSADEVIASTNASAAALGEAADALHRWVDGMLLHGANSSAATLEVVQAIVRGGQSGSSLRGAHASLEALMTRLQYVCDDVVRTRQQLAKRTEECARLDGELSAEKSRSQELRKRAETLEGVALDAEESTRIAKHAEEEARAASQVSDRSKSEAQARAADVQASLEPRRQLACAMAVQLSDALRRSGAVSAEAPMLVDSSCSSLPWEQISSTLAALVSHVSYYWAAHQRELAEAHAQLKLARERMVDKEQSLARAAAIATGLKLQAGAPGSRMVPWRARKGDSRVGGAKDAPDGGGGLMASDFVSP